MAFLIGSPPKGSRWRRLEDAVGTSGLGGRVVVRRLDSMVVVMTVGGMRVGRLDVELEIEKSQVKSNQMRC